MQSPTYSQFLDKPPPKHSRKGPSLEHNAFSEVSPRSSLSPLSITSNTEHRKSGLSGLSTASFQSGLLSPFEEGSLTSARSLFKSDQTKFTKSGKVVQLDSWSLPTFAQREEKESKSDTKALNQHQLGWSCTICTKENPTNVQTCSVCGREKGYISSDEKLPFHPPFSSFDGARKFLDYRKIESFLKAGVNPDSKDTEGWTGLHWAVALARLDLAALYLEYGSNINVQRHDGWTALHVACQVGDEEACVFLLQVGADPNIVCNHDGYAPIHIAAKGNFNKCVEALALAGADLNMTSKVAKFTALHLACLAGSYDVVVSLLLVSEDPLRTVHADWLPVELELKDVDGWTAFDLANIREHKRITSLLNSRNAGFTKYTKLIRDHLHGFKSGGG